MEHLKRTIKINLGRKKKRKKKWRKKEKRNDRDPMRMQLIVRQFRSIKTIKIDLFDTPALAKKKKKRNKLANQRGEGGVI